MKISLNEEDIVLLGRYMDAREEYNAAKKAAGPKLVAVADLFEHGDLDFGPTATNRNVELNCPTPSEPTITILEP